MFNTFIRVATQLDSLFLYECYKNSAEHNRFDPLAISLASENSMYELIREHVNERNIDNNLFIVNKSGKDIGFFTSQFNHTSGVIGGVVFLHPRACKMAIITMVKCLTIFDLLFCIEGHAEYISINLWHPYLVHAAVSVLPSFVVNSFLPSQFYVNSHAECHLATYIDAVKPYLIQNIQKDGCFECTI